MGVACPPAGRTSDQTVLPVLRSIARIRLSVAAAMKISPLAVTTAPPLFGVPLVTGSIDGIPNGTLVRGVPKIGRPSCRERGFLYVEFMVVAVAYKNKMTLYIFIDIRILHV